MRLWLRLAAPLLAALGLLAQTPAQPSADVIYLRAREALRDGPHPAYLIYVLHRSITVDGVLEQHTDRVVLRTRDARTLVATDDGAPVVQRMRATPDAMMRAVESDTPPAFDVFSGLDTDAAIERSIGRVTTRVSRYYRVRLARRELRNGRPLYHLMLTPRRDPELHQTRELWVDAATYAVPIAVVLGHVLDGEKLYAATVRIEQEAIGPYTLIVRITGSAATHGVDPSSVLPAPAANFFFDYAFDDIKASASDPGWPFGSP